MDSLFEAHEISDITKGPAPDVKWFFRMDDPSMYGLRHQGIVVMWEKSKIENKKTPTFNVI